MSTSRDELRARNVQLIARWLSAYVREGHGLTLETRFSREGVEVAVVRNKVVERLGREGA